MFVLFWLHQVCFAESTVSEERAKELFYNGQLLYEEQEYESAVLAWQKGYEITQLPAFLKNIALAHEANQDYPKAIDYLKQYRAFAPFEEQEELKVWLVDLESKQAKYAAEQAKVEEQAQQEQGNNTNQNTTETEIDTTNAAANQQPETLPTADPQKNNPLFIGAIGSTAILATSATLMTMRTASLYTAIESGCDLSTGLCTQSVLDDGLLDDFQGAQNTSLLLWGTTLVGAGFTTWQLLDQGTETNTSLHFNLWNRGLLIGGTF